MENRISKRHKAEHSIVCTVFASQQFSHPSGGKLKNYSQSGMYAELQDCFGVGTILLLRTAGSTSEQLSVKIEEGFRSLSLVEVKWSTPLTTDGGVRYGIGLKHLASYYHWEGQSNP